MIKEGFIYTLFFGKWAYAVKIVLAAAGLIGLNFLTKKIMSEIRKRSLSKYKDWREKIHQIVHLPFFIGLWIVGLSFGFNILKEHFGFIHLSYINTIRNCLLIACGSWMLLRWVKVMRQVLIEKSKSVDISLGSVQVLSRVCSFTIMTLSALLILQILGINILPLLAFGGISAAAVGFAAKEVIANFFGGIMLHMTRPFVVGDTIVIPSKNDLIGVVEEIGLYMTQIRDVEKRPVYLPNALFSSMLIVNMSQMTHRRIYEVIKLSFEEIEKLPSILESIRAVIAAHSRVDNHLPFHVVLKELGTYSVDILIEGYTLATRQEEYFKVKQEILLSINEALKAHGADFSLQTRGRGADILKEILTSS